MIIVANSGSMKSFSIAHRMLLLTDQYFFLFLDKKMTR